MCLPFQKASWLQEAAEIVALGQKQVLEDSKVPNLEIAVGLHLQLAS